MIYCVLLVNKADSRLSALPAVDVFNQGDFLTNPDVILTAIALVEEGDYVNIANNRDHVFIVAPGLPLSEVDQIDDPSRIYYQYSFGEMTLTAVPVSMDVYVADARQRRGVELQTAFERAKRGRFTYNDKWYDGSDFLVFALGFQSRGQDSFFSCAESETGPFQPVPHTVAEITSAGEAFYTWYMGMQGAYYTKRTALEAADTLEEIEAIVW